MTGTSWQCSICTYRHEFKAERCAMCSQPRITKTDMINFIQGKPILPKTQEPASNTAQEIMKETIKLSPFSEAKVEGADLNVEVHGAAASFSSSVIDNIGMNHSNVKNPASSNPSNPRPIIKSSNPYLKKSSSVLKQSVLQLNHVNSTSENTKTVVQFKVDDTSMTSKQFEGLKQPENTMMPNIKNPLYLETSNNKVSKTTAMTGEEVAVVTTGRIETTTAVAAAVAASTPMFHVSSLKDEQSNTRPAVDFSFRSTSNTVQQLNDKNPYRKSNNSSMTGPNAQRKIQPTEQPKLNNLSIPRRVVGFNESNTTVNHSLNPKVVQAASTSNVMNHDHSYQPGPVPLDEEAAQTWVFPKSDSYRERKYQLDICQSALINNTLVSLPTGLGKTLIAAVVMYNFYRWFPEGKVIFLAPTRPLVSQQIDACYKVMKIPEKDTAEITGRQKGREILWSSRRVFFCTPQTFQKDIEENRCETKKIVCICFDEAHKATGKYAYAQVIQMVESAGAKFRVLGLSATPGKDTKTISQVLVTLRISKIEARLESDPDVKEYVHERVYEIIKCDVPDTISTLENHLLQVMNPLYDRIRKRRHLPLLNCGISNLNAYQVLQSRRECNQTYNDHSLDQLFSALQSLLTIRERLMSSGVGVARNELNKFRSNLANNALAREIIGSSSFQAIVAILTETVENQIISGSSVDNQNPKLVKLKEVLSSHFSASSGESSRAIVFSQWRDSVEEIVSFLKATIPSVKAAKFVGQSSGSTTITGSDNEDDEDNGGIKKWNGKRTKVMGMNQSEQQAALSSFRKGLFNVLVCTCIGEEGLDICEVDLIVNFDCLRSPIRMVQRTGRTGRNRDGRVVCLVSKGPEERRLEKSEEDKKRLWNALKKPNFFKLSSCVPLLPYVPHLERKILNSSSKSCRLSQIGGNENRKFNRKRIRTSLARTVEDESWILTSVQERNRVEQFGDFQFLEQSKRRKLYIRFWQEEVMLKRNDTTCENFGMRKHLIKMEETLSNSRTHHYLAAENSHHQRRHWFRNSINIFKVRTRERFLTTRTEECSEPKSLLVCDSLSSSPSFNTAAAPSQELTNKYHQHYDDHFDNLNNSFHFRGEVSSAQNGSKPETSSQPGKLPATEVFEFLQSSPIEEKMALANAEPVTSQQPWNVSVAEVPHSFTSTPFQQDIANDDRVLDNATQENKRDQLIDAMIESVNIVLSAQDSSSESDDSSLCQERPRTDSLDSSHKPSEGNFEGLPYNADDITPIKAKMNVSKMKRGRFLESQSPFIHHNGGALPSKNLPSNTQYLVDTPSVNTGEDREQSDNIRGGTKAGNPSKKKKEIYNSSGMKYLDLEAVEDGDEKCTDDDDDEEDGDNSFDYEDSFINDSSQLGFTQGGLADESVIFSNGKACMMSLDVHMYRQVDNARTIKEQYNTPVLGKRNKQAKKASKQQQVGFTQDLEGFNSIPFIRTVLEHHRQGGNADELERNFQDFYSDS